MLTRLGIPGGTGDEGPDTPVPVTKKKRGRRQIIPEDSKCKALHISNDIVLTVIVASSDDTEGYYVPEPTRRHRLPSKPTQQDTDGWYEGAAGTNLRKK